MIYSWVFTFFRIYKQWINCLGLPMRYHRWHRMASFIEHSRYLANLKVNIFMENRIGLCLEILLALKYYFSVFFRWNIDVSRLRSVLCNLINNNLIMGKSSLLLFRKVAKDREHGHENQTTRDAIIGIGSLQTT